MAACDYETEVLLKRIYMDDVRAVMAKIPAGMSRVDLAQHLLDYAKAVERDPSAADKEEGRYVLAKFRTAGRERLGAALKAEVDALAVNLNSMLVEPEPEAATPVTKTTSSREGLERVAKVQL